MLAELRDQIALVAGVVFKSLVVHSHVNMADVRFPFCSFTLNQLVSACTAFFGHLSPLLLAIILKSQ